MNELKSVFVEDVKSIRDKIPSSVRRTMSTYTTKSWTQVILHCFYQWNEKVAYYFDYWYAKVLKDFVKKVKYTDFKDFM